MSDERLSVMAGKEVRFSNRFKTKYLWLIFFMWIAYGQLVAYGIAQKYLYDAVFLVWDSVFRYVPAIWRLKDVYSFGVELARLQATAMLATTPVLFILMLAASVEGTVRGTRVKQKEALVVSVLIFVAVLVLVAGFENDGPGDIFYSSYALYSAFTATMTFFVAYFLRLIFCLLFNKQTSREQP